jgi:phosphoesterase RecJ-like protein
MKPLEPFAAADVEALKALIEASHTFVMICHTNPDGDAMGSSLGLANWLRCMGKDAVVVVPDLYPDFLQWLPGAQESVRADKYPEKVRLLLLMADVVICLDFNTPDRIESIAPLLDETRAKKVLIDHHLNPDAFCDLTFSRSAASSTSELVFTLIHSMGGYDMLTKQAAECLYCGMMTDTGGFTFNSNRSEIFNIIAALLAKDIDKDDIYRRVFNNYSEGRLRLMGYALYEKMRVFPEHKAALIALSKEEMARFKFVKGDTEGLVNIPLQMRGIRLSCFLREDTERGFINVSLRGVGTFACNDFAARYFNGGGHRNASGGRYYGPLDEAVACFEKALVEFGV